MATHHRIDNRDARGGGVLVGTGDEPQVRDLLKQLASDGSDLVRSEIALAKLEMGEMAREIALDSAKLGAALGIALMGGLAVLAAAIIGLGHLLDGRFGLAALTVGVIMLGIGGLMARGGLRGLRHAPRPEQTARSLQRDRAWASEEVREFTQQIRS